MNDTNPRLSTVKRELMDAIRRDHARRMARRKALRTIALTAAVVTALTGTALAATTVLGVINLGGGLRAARVSNLPEWDGMKGTFTTGGADNPYIYHVTDGSNPTLDCGSTDRHPTNNIYITSTHPLPISQLKELVAEELSHETRSAKTAMKEFAEGNLPPGVHWVKKGRHPTIAGPPNSASKPLPRGVTSISNGCPTPGVAGQPGSAGSAPAPGERAVTVAPSVTHKR